MTTHKEQQPAENYSPAASVCHVEQSVLLIVDIQDRLTSIMPDKVVSRVRRHTGMLLRAAGLLDVPVIATEQYPQGLGQLEEDLARLIPAGSARYEKTCFSCTDVEELQQRLSTMGRRQIIIAGIEAHICVLQTALDLRQAGHEVFVVGDAVCSRNRENYENALQRLRHAEVVISDAESVVFEWLRDSKHPHFKALSAMIQGK